MKDILPQSLDHSLEGVLPSVHLDHSDSHNHLIHDTHTFVCDPRCLKPTQVMCIIQSLSFYGLPVIGIKLGSEKLSENN